MLLVHYFVINTQQWQRLSNLTLVHALMGFLLNHNFHPNIIICLEKPLRHEYILGQTQMPLTSDFVDFSLNRGKPTSLIVFTGGCPCILSFGSMCEDASDCRKKVVVGLVWWWD